MQQLYTIINGSPNFKASHGWLEKFKNRYNIAEFVTKGKKLSADDLGAEMINDDGVL
jgi:hypothetical protein